MKRIISYLLFILILNIIFTSCSLKNIKTQETSELLPPLKDTILNGYERLLQSVDLKAYNIPYNNDGSVPELEKIVEEIIDERPDLFYIKPVCTYTAESIDSGLSYKIDEINLNYKYDIDLIPAKISDFENRLNAIIDSIPFVKEVKDYDAVVLIHDYICVNYSYDESLKTADAYTMLCTGSGVCQAYTGLFKCLMDKLDIKSCYVKGCEINHIWNQVCIDGDWYNVDTTWDDYFTNGTLLHIYCLSSDEITESDIREGGTVRDMWGSQNSCWNNRFDNAYWKNSASPVVFMSPDTAYYTRSERSSRTSYLTKYLNGASEDILQFDNRWSFDPVYITGYVGCYSGLVYDEEYLYFNGPGTIYRYSEDGEVEMLAGNIGDEANNIYGMTIKDEVIYCMISNRPYEEGIIYTMDIKKLKEKSEEKSEVE